jgi:hypothetical protein
MTVTRDIRSTLSGYGTQEFDQHRYRRREQIAMARIDRALANGTNPRTRPKRNLCLREGAKLACPTRKQVAKVNRALRNTLQLLLQLTVHSAK